MAGESALRGVLWINMECFINLWEHRICSFSTSTDHIANCFSWQPHHFFYAQGTIVHPFLLRATMNESTDGNIPL